MDLLAKGRGQSLRSKKVKELVIKAAENSHRTEERSEVRTASRVKTSDEKEKDKTNLFVDLAGKPSCDQQWSHVSINTEIQQCNNFVSL